MGKNIRTGIDIVDINRIKRILKNKKQDFLYKVFSDMEIKYIEDKASKVTTIAGMFSAKEAVSKLLGNGIGKIGWRDIEIHHEESGRPYIYLNKKIREGLEKKDIVDIDISISHEKDYAIAIAVGVKNSKHKRNFEDKSDLTITIPDEFSSLLPERKMKTHKGSYGRLAIIAGSRGMSGAPYLSSLAALRTGTGLVYTVVPEYIEDIMSIKLTEAIVKPVKDDKKGYFTRNSLKDILNIIENMDVIGIGPGIGVGEDRLHIIEEIINNYNNPIILDADALNCLSINPDILYNKNKEIIITPHPGELGRLLGKSTEEIQENRIFYSKYTADKYNVVVALKGSKTVVACPGSEDVYINGTGNPGMATAGSGDVLTGMICAFVAQALNSFDSAKLGVFTHGLAGDLSKLEKGEYGLIATDIIDNIPKSINIIQEDNF